MVNTVYDRPGHEVDDTPPELVPDETDPDLEESFGAPDATDDNLPPNHPSRREAMNDKALASAEMSGKDKKDGAGKDEEDGLFSSHDDDRPSRFHLSRNKGIAGGIATLLVAGTIGSVSILSGPLKILHYAENLKSFHFLSQEDGGSDRMSHIARYIRNKNTPERTRLGRMGNFYADQIEKRMNKSGVQSMYSEKYGYGTGYAIDYQNVSPESPLYDTIGDKTPEGVRSAIADHYGISTDKVTVHTDGGPLDGKISIDSSELGYFKSRKLMKSVMGDAGMDGIGEAMRTRIMGKRAGVTWHPIKKLDRKVLESLDAKTKAWKEERRQRLAEGESPVTAQDPVAQDANGDGTSDPPSADAEAASAQSHAVADESASANNGLKSGDATGLESLRSSTSLKIAGGVTAAVGVICAIKGISDQFDTIKYDNVALPMMRAGMEFVALGSQIQSGKDIDMQILSLYAKQMFQEAGERKNGSTVEKIPASSASNARSYQAENGDPQTGPDLPSEARLDKDGNFIGNFVNSIPGINGVCDAANSIFGQVASFGIDLISGPFGAVAGVAFGQLVLPTILDKIVNWLAGDPLDITNAAGANYGNILNYGTRLAANDSAMAGGGKPLSNSESIALKEYQQNAVKEDLQSKSFAYRMFDPYDSGTLVSKIIDRQNPGIENSMSNVASGLIDLPNLLFSPIKAFGSMFTGGTTAAASSTYDYGFPRFGFSVEELNDPAFDNPFDNANAVMDILNGPSGDDYIERAEKCFGMILTKDGNAAKSIEKSPNYTVAADPANNCADSSQSWTRIRFYVFDTQMMESQACYEGDSDSCTNLGFPDQGGAGTQTPGSSVPPSPGTGPIDESQTSEIPGAPGIRIATAILPQFTAMLGAARADSIDLLPISSGWRDPAKQIELRKQNCPDWQNSPSGDCSPPTAKPGTSNHEGGRAVDFSDMCFSESGSTSCNGNPRWEWLVLHAKEYGFYPLATEAWHWSTTGG